MLDVLKTITDRMQGKAPKGAKRSSKWRKVRKEHLKNNPCCAVCGQQKKIELHHIIPFHLAPDLELDPRNLISLCSSGKYGIKSCHILFGHRGSWKKFNASVREDAYIWNHRLRGYKDAETEIKSGRQKIQSADNTKV